MTNIHDAIRYQWTEELAKDFFYEKCHGKPQDVIKDIEQLIKDVVEAREIIESDNKILNNIPF